MASAITRAVITFIVLAGALAFALTQPAKLGLDLRGGAQIVLEAQDTDKITVNAEATDRAIAVLGNRINALGVAESSITRSGERRIIVELPGVDDPNEAVDTIGKTAQLTFHPVLDAAPPPSTGQGNGGGGDAGQGGEGDNQGDADPNEGGQQNDGAGEGDNSGDGAEQSEETDGNDNSQSLGETDASTQPAAYAADAPEPDATTEPPTDEETSGEEGEGDAGTDPSDQTSGELKLPDEDGNQVTLGPAAFTGEGVNDSAGEIDQQSLRWVVTIDFNGDGGSAYQELTAEAACADYGQPQRRIAIVLDNEVISSPPVAPEIKCGTGIAGNSTMISGSFTEESAKDLAALVKGGALPIPVEVIEQRVVGPTLGQEAIDASLKAAIVGLILTGLFILLIYRLMGLLATLALACYALIAYASLVLIGATLTLPGLAGFVLAIGMAIDANVLIFERAREEYAQRSAAGLRPALVRGARGAWSAIIDSNVTTLLAAGLLFFLASGPVRGFGVTLSLGVVASMFSALVIARMFTEWAAARRFINKRPKLSGIHTIGRLRTWLTERNPNLMQHSTRWLIVSAALVAIAFAGIGVRGLNFGVDFTGGRVIEYSTNQQVDIEDARAAVSDAGFPRAIVQESGSGDVANISVRVSELSNDQERDVTAALDELAGGVQKESDELIGPSLGSELRTKAAIALAIALVIQMGYIALRFRWFFGVATIAAMFHDLIIVIGLFAWLGKPIDSVFLAAALSIIGLSVNDKIVISDRIRELWAADPRRPFRESCNLAVLQTVPRTVNTGLSTLFILATLAVFGGDSLRDFAIALLVGLSIGVLSSMFTAAPLTSVLLESRKGEVVPPSAGKKDRSKGKERAQRAGSGAVV